MENEYSFDTIYEYIRDIAKSKEELDMLRRIISTPDAGRIKKLTPKVIEAGVYIPDKNKLLRRLERLSEDHFPAIVGDNGDGKTLILKSLSVLFSDKKAKYVMITEDFEISDERLFVDGLDESIEIDEDGNLRFREDVNNKIRRIVSLFSAGRIKGPVFAFTLGVFSLSHELMTDFHRRIKSVINLQERRPEAFNFVLMRDVAYFYVLKEPNPERAFSVYSMLTEELSGIIKDSRKRRVSDVNRLYYSTFEHASDEGPRITENIRNAPSKYHKTFEENSIRILREVTGSLARFLDIDITIKPLGGPNEPDAEIIIISKEGETRIAFDAKFVKREFSEPSYTSRYPYTIYFVASLTRQDREDVFRLPYSLGYLLAVDPLEAEYFMRYFNGLKYKVLEALRRASGSAERVVDTKLLKVVECLEKLAEVKRDKKERRYKRFYLKEIENKICPGINGKEFVELVNNYCEDLIIKESRRRYKFSRDPIECIEKMKKLLGA